MNKQDGAGVVFSRVGGDWQGRGGFVVLAVVPVAGVDLGRSGIGVLVVMTVAGVDVCGDWTSSLVCSWLGFEKTNLR